MYDSNDPVMYYCRYVDAVMTERRITNMDVDIMNGVVYWADSSLGAIKRASVPADPTQLGVSQTLLHDSSALVQPTGVAYDWIGK